MSSDTSIINARSSLSTVWIRVAMFIERYVLSVPMLVFLALCFGFVWSYEIGSFPDEREHLGYVSDVVKAGYPDYRSGHDFVKGTLNHLNHPPIYYLTAGYLAKMFAPLTAANAWVVRLVNVLISSLTLIIVYLGMRKTELNAASILFGMATLLSIPLLITLSSSVNNDPMTFLGCALTTSGLIYFYDQKNWCRGFNYLLFGIGITFLSKATGALAVICTIAAFITLNPRLTRRIINSLSRAQWMSAAFTTALILAYYGATYALYGKIFPSPSSAPSDWDIDGAMMSSPRLTLQQHWQHFISGNLSTLLSPYGHTEFLDHSTRLPILKNILRLFPLFALIASIGEFRAKSPRWRFVLATVLGAASFFAVYFFKIRNMHLATGYQGGIQARYAFGFLPALAVIYGLAFKHLRHWLIKLPLLAYVSLGVAYLFYCSYVKIIYPVVIGQSVVNTNFGELTAGRTFAQTFLAKAERLKKVELQLATYKRRNHGRVILKILDKDGLVIGWTQTDAADINDNSWVTFTFDLVNTQVNQVYTLSLTAPEGKPGDSITWWAALSNGATGVEHYAEGQAAVDGKHVDGDYSFKVYSGRNS